MASMREIDLKSTCPQPIGGRHSTQTDVSEPCRADSRQDRDHQRT